MTKRIFFAFILLGAGLLLALPSISQAIFIQSDNEVNTDQTIDGNFFAAGNIVNIAGTVNGDVFAVGNNITITGTINGDVFAAGNSVLIDGEVAGNLRLAGSNVSIHNKVGKNVIAAGSQLIIHEQGEINGHLTCASAALSINGPVHGNIDAASSETTINSEIGRDVELRLDQGKLTLRPKALIRGNLKYSADQEAEISEGAVVEGEIEYKPFEEKEHAAKVKVFGFLTLGFWIGVLIKLVSLFILGFLIAYLLPRPIEYTYSKMTKKPGASLLIGFAILFLTPIIAVILMITVVGIPLAMMLLSGYAIALYAVRAIAALIIGRLITQGLKLRLHSVWQLLIGVIVMIFLSVIPFVGWLLSLLITIWALGAVFKVKIMILKKMRVNTLQAQKK